MKSRIFIANLLMLILTYIQNFIYFNFLAFRKLFCMQIAIKLENINGAPARNLITAPVAPQIFSRSRGFWPALRSMH
jgi:hypothetical protein